MMKRVGGAVASPSISFRVFTITTLFHGFYRKSSLRAERRDEGMEGERGHGEDWEGEGKGTEYGRERDADRGREKGSRGRGR